MGPSDGGIEATLAEKKRMDLAQQGKQQQQRGEIDRGQKF